MASAADGHPISRAKAAVDEHDRLLLYESKPSWAIAMNLNHHGQSRRSVLAFHAGYHCIQGYGRHCWSDEAAGFQE
jgi:hypothetical protein